MRRCSACAVPPPPPPVPQESPSAALPLYTEEWVEEVLGRCFAIITNLDSPEHRGEWVGDVGGIGGGWEAHRSQQLGVCGGFYDAILFRCPPDAALPADACRGPHPVCVRAAGEHGGQRGGGALLDEGSFLLDSNSMFRPLMELLFCRLPPALRRSAVRTPSPAMRYNCLLA